MKYGDLYLAQNRQCLVPFSFNALYRNDPCRISGKALCICWK